MTAPDMTAVERARVAARIEDYLGQIKRANSDDLPGRAVSLEMTLAGIIRNEWPTIKAALAALPQPAGAERAERREEIARAAKRGRHRRCCTGAALDDVCAVLTIEDYDVADAILALPREPGEAWRGIESARKAFEHISILLPEKRDPLDADVLAWEMVRIARRALAALPSPPGAKG